MYDLKELIEQFAKSTFRLKGVYRFNVAPGSEGVQRSMPYPGFVFPIMGQAQFDFDGTPYVTDVKKVIHGSADVPLGKKVLSDTPLQYFSVFYEMAQQHSKHIMLSDAHFDLEVGMSPRLKVLLNRLWKVSAEPSMLSSFRTTTLFYNVLEEMFTCADGIENRRMPHLFTQIASYMRTHYGDNLSINDLAALYELTPNQLYYMFKKQTNMSPGAYWTEYRLNRAKALMMTTDLPVQDVSSAVGYEDPLYFSRVFKDKIGCAPSVWRKHFRKNP